MSSIDERIVSMQFDNQAFEKNVGTSLDSLKKLESSVDGLNGLNTDKLADQISNISDRFNVLGIIGMTALQNITNRFVDMGVKMAKSLTIDQVSAGFDKYTENTKNVKALLNSTGLSIDEVSEKLDSLSWYSDATSYSYNAMTSALKSFTAQDIDIDKAIPAIMGIGNSLSYAGLAAEEAGAAFNLYSKAMGQGYLGNIQWKSLNLMGAATSELKRNFIEAAVAEGTLKEVGDGLYKTNQGLSVSLQDFDMTLSHQKGKWLTNAVMMRVFGEQYGSYTQKLQAFMAQEENASLTVDQAMKKYAELHGELDEFGKKAFLAAQEARTFNEAVSAVKDAASSAWRGIFENVFGNAEEATAMWTSFSNWLYDAFMGPTEMMYALTTEWKRLGGREGMLKGFANLAEALNKIVEPIKRAFNAIFGVATGSKLGAILKDITDKFEAFTAKLIISDETTGKLIKIFTGLFSVIKIIKDALGNLVDGFLNLLGLTKPLGGSLLDAAANFGMFLNKMRVFIDEKGGLLSGFGAFCGALRETLENAKPVEFIFGKIKDAASFLGEKLKELGKQLKDTFGPKFRESFNFDNFFKFVAALGGLSALKLGVLDPLKNLSGILSNFEGLLDPVISTLSKFSMQISPIVPNLKETATSLLILAGALFLLSSIDPERLASGLAGLASAMGMMTKFMTSFSSNLPNLGKGLEGLAKSFEAGQMASSMIKIAGALLIVSFALKMLGGLDLDEMLQGIIGIGAVMFELSVFANSLNTVEITPKTGMAMILIATSLLIMSKAIESIGTLDLGVMQQGLLGIAGILAEIGIFSRLLDPTGMVSTSIAMVILGGAILIIAQAIDKMGSMPFEVIIQGLTSMGAALTVLGIALKLIPSNIGAAVSIGILSVSMIAMGEAFKILGSIQFDQIGHALAAILPTLAAAFVLFKFLNPVTTIAVSASLVVFAAAINLLVPAFYALGNLSLQQIGLALLAIAGSIGLLGGMAFLLQGLIVPMLGLAAAMGLFGVGVAAFATGMATLAASGTVAAATLVGTLEIFLTSVPMLGEAILKALTALIEAFCGALLAAGPTLLATLKTTIESILGFLIVEMPKFIEMGMTIVISFINGITAKLPELVDAAVTMIVTFLNSLATSLEKNKDTLIKSIDTLILTIFDIVWGAITGLLKMIKDRIPEIWQKGIDFIGGFLLGIAEKGKEINDKMWEMVDRAGEAIDAKMKEIKEWGANIFKKIKEGLVEAFEKPINGIKTVAKNLLEGFKKGLDDPTTQNSLMAKVGGVGSKILGKFREVLGIASPSKETELLAEWMMKGFVVGIDATTFEAEEEAAKASEKILEAFGDPLAEMIAKLEEDVEMNPTITPVLDLTEFDAGIDHMGSGISMVQEIIGDVKAETNLESWKKKFDEWKKGSGKWEDLTYELATGHAGSGRKVQYGASDMDMAVAAANGMMTAEARKVWQKNATKEDVERAVYLYQVNQNITSPSAIQEAEIYRQFTNGMKDITAKQAIESAHPYKYGMGKNIIVQS